MGYTWIADIHITLDDLEAKIFTTIAENGDKAREILYIEHALGLVEDVRTDPVFLALGRLRNGGLVRLARLPVQPNSPQMVEIWRLTRIGLHVYERTTGNKPAEHSKTFLDTNPEPTSGYTRRGHRGRRGLRSSEDEG